MLDVKEWKPWLEGIFAVERESLFMQFIRRTAFYEGILEITQVLAGDIDDIMLNGVDSKGFEVKFGFTLVNLDYQGGVLYKQLAGGSKRISAIKKLIERQSETRKSFLLFLTVNARNRDQRELDLTLRGIGRTLEKYRIDARDVIEWYANPKAGYDFKMKVYVPYLLSEIASLNHYRLVPFPPVTYIGTNSVRMMHFSFRMDFVPGTAGPVEKPSLVELVNIPMLEPKNGKVVGCATKAPIVKLG